LENWWPGGSVDNALPLIHFLKRISKKSAEFFD
jgi:hypothetical protein